MIKPQDKRDPVKRDVTLPAACMDCVETHAKALDNSSPEYVIAAIVQDYFDTGRDKEAGSNAKPKTERSAHSKEATNTVAMPKSERRR